MTTRIAISAVLTSVLAATTGCGGSPEDRQIDETTAELSAASYAGMDAYAYPGSAQMSWLRTRTNLRWTGFYLGGAPNHGDTSWMSQRSTLVSMGWGLAPIYVGRQVGQASLSRSQGVTDGESAASLAAQAGFPRGAVVYLDVEEGGTLPADLVSYYEGWVSGVVAMGYSPGVYCSYSTTANQLTQADARATVWVFDIGSSSCPAAGTTSFAAPAPTQAWTGAQSWQFAQNCRVTDAYGTLNIDVNSSSTPDPSVPTVPPLSTPASPVNYATVSGSYVPLVWHPAETATYFEIPAWYWTGSAWAYLGVLSSTTPSLAASLTKGYYYAWAVESCNAAGCSAPSTTATFYYSR